MSERQGVCILKEINLYPGSDRADPSSFSLKNLSKSLFSVQMEIMPNNRSVCQNTAVLHLIDGIYCAFDRDVFCRKFSHSPSRKHCQNPDTRAFFSDRGFKKRVYMK